VVKVSWAHPEFGQVIASGSLDRTLKIWEYCIISIEEPPTLHGVGVNSGLPFGVAGKEGMERACLTENRGALQDFEFSSRHLGLKLVGGLSLFPFSKLDKPPNLHRPPSRVRGLSGSLRPRTSLISPSGTLWYGIWSLIIACFYVLTWEIRFFLF